VLQQVPAFLTEHSGHILRAPDGSDWVVYGPAGIVWHLTAGKTAGAGQVIATGNIQLAATPPVITWDDGPAEPIAFPITFEDTGTRYPLADLYAAFVGMPLKRAVGPLPAGATLGGDLVVHLTSAASGKPAAATIWFSHGQQVTLVGAFGTTVVKADDLAAAAR
jgi:hypothetical protein